MANFRTKKRGYHQNGLKQDNENRSLDMCPVCISFCCDPMLMSHKFSHKIHERKRMGLCHACGKPADLCSCKSTMDKSKVNLVKTHNNKKLRQARTQIAAAEKAYRLWSNNEETLCRVFNYETYANILDSLYHHKVPTYPWQYIVNALDAHNLDATPYRAGWHH